MALITPDYLQTKTYAAKRDRRVNQALIMQEGIVNVEDFKVTQRGAGANMSVDVALGEAWVDGDSSVDQGFYHVVNDATVNVAIANNSSGNPRIDTLVLKVNDSADAGSGTDTPALEIVQGTPTAAATLSNLNGIAALPSTALRLAYILVANGAVSILNAQVGNLVDPRRGTTGYPAVAEPKAVSLAPPQYAMGRPAGYVPSVQAVRNATLEVGSGVPTAVPFTSADNFDTESMHDTVTANTRMVVRTPGIYAVTGAVVWNLAQLHVGFFRTNGVNSAFYSESNSQSVTPSGMYRLGFGDYVEFMVQQSSGAARTMTGYMHMAWIGP